MAVPSEGIDSAEPLHAKAVDSLLAVEMRNWFATNFKADVAISVAMEVTSIVSVGEMVVGKGTLKRRERVE